MIKQENLNKNSCQYIIFPISHKVETKELYTKIFDFLHYDSHSKDSDQNSFSSENDDSQKNLNFPNNSDFNNKLEEDSNSNDYFSKVSQMQLNGIAILFKGFLQELNYLENSEQLISNYYNKLKQVVIRLNKDLVIPSVTRSIRLSIKLLYNVTKDEKNGNLDSTANFITDSNKRKVKVVFNRYMDKSLLSKEHIALLRAIPDDRNKKKILAKVYGLQKFRVYQSLKFYSKQGFELDWTFSYRNWVNGKVRANIGSDCMKPYKELAKRKELKGIVTNNFDNPAIVVLDQEALKDFYTTKYMFFEKNSQFAMVAGPIAGTKNIITDHHKDWKKTRTAVSKSFSFNRIKASLPIIINVARDNFSREEKSNGKIEIMDLFQNITGESFMLSFIGEDLMKKEINGQSISNELASLFQALMQSFITKSKPLMFLEKIFNVNLEFRGEHKILLARIETFRNILKLGIQSKREKYEKDGPDESLVSELFEGKQFTDEQIVNETIILFFAAIDTTSHLLTSIMYVFGHHPEYQKEFVKEIQDKIQNSSNISTESLKDSNLPFVHAIIQESLRLYNPSIGLFLRDCIQDTQLGDFFVKKGTNVFILPYISSMSNQYFENPEVYDPYRWINNKQDEILNQNPFAFLPFSAGNRNCLGQHFARLEAKAVLVYLSLNYNLEVEKSNTRWVARFLHEPEEHLYMKIKRIPK